MCGPVSLMSENEIYCPIKESDVFFTDNVLLISAEKNDFAGIRSWEGSVFIHKYFCALFRQHELFISFRWQKSRERSAVALTPFEWFHVDRKNSIH